MSSASVIGIKGATVRVSVRGCVDCSTEHSDGWQVADHVPVVVGRAKRWIELHRCNRCTEARKEADRPTDKNE